MILPSWLNHSCPPNLHVHGAAVNQFGRTRYGRVKQPQSIGFVPRSLVTEHENLGVNGGEL
jgi:hypothetical protein